MKFKISIGILAHNEAASIGKTLQSLLHQSLFNNPDPSTVINIVVVANGCTDETAVVARATLEELVKQSSHPSINGQVCEVEQPGKCNAWNHYVREFSDPAADYLFLMDADIQFLETDTLHNMLDALESTPDAWVSVDTPIKDVTLKKNKNLMEWLSVLVSASGGKGRPGICGQLYCGRAAILRRICLPTTMQVEDGFIATMVRSNCFTSPEVSERIVRAKSASHAFEAYTDLNRLLRHERWLVLCNTIDCFLYTYLWANCNAQQDAGSLIDRRNKEDPQWLHKFIRETVLKKGWWVLPDWLLLRRFRSLRNYSPLKSILLLPVVVVAFLADLLVCFQANQELLSGGGMNYWGKTQNSSS